MTDIPVYGRPKFEKHSGGSGAVWRPRASHPVKIGKERVVTEKCRKLSCLFPQNILDPLLYFDDESNYKLVCFDEFVNLICNVFFSSEICLAPVE